MSELLRGFPVCIPTFLDKGVLDPALYRYLLEISNALKSTLSGFPDKKCRETGQYVELRTGLERVFGVYIAPTKKGYKWAPHVWNTTNDGLYYVDLSLYQFNHDFPEIGIIDVNSTNLQPDDIWECTDGQDRLQMTHNEIEKIDAFLQKK